MAEQTNPEGGVSQEPSDPYQRVSALLEQSQDPAPEAESEERPEHSAAEQPEGQAESDELSPDDIPDENEAPQPVSVDAFEIVHDGQQHKLNREETIKYAQQGFDYTKKTQALAEQQKAVTERLGRLAQIEQVQPLLANDLAQVTALESQLKAYQDYDWVQLATNDPLEYPKYRAHYDQIAYAYQKASNQLQQRANAVNQERQRVTAEMLQQEAARLPELIPAWKDEAKKVQGQQEVATYLRKAGVPDEVIGQRLDNALAVAFVWKAMQYDKLVASKSEKVKQLRTAPPVTRPGSTSPGQEKSDKERGLRESLKKTGDRHTAAAVLLNRMK